MHNKKYKQKNTAIHKKNEAAAAEEKDTEPAITENRTFF